MVDYQYCAAFTSGPMSRLEATILEQKEKIASGIASAVNGDMKSFQLCLITLPFIQQTV